MNAAQFEDLLTLLNDIRARLGHLEKHGAPPAAAPPPVAAQPAAAADPGYADEAELDGPYGDPEIRRDPPRWKGESYVGRHYSDCPPEYLDQIASFNVWRAQKDDDQNAVDAKGRPKSYWAKLDAARARGWARRIRGAQPRVTTTARTSSVDNRVAYVPKPVEGGDLDDEVPF